MFQKTIKKEVSFSGRGLHTNQRATVKLLPAGTGTGILFIVKGKRFPLSLSSLFHTTRSITLGDAKRQIMTVEHLAAALYMKGVTNLLVETDAGEMPALDGSSRLFLNHLEKAGIEIQKKEIRPLAPGSVISLMGEDKFIIALPSDRLKITYNVDFNHPLLKNKTIHFDRVDERVFAREIAPARTFGFESEVKGLLARGLARGGSLKNAVVLTRDGMLNKKLRFPDECARHKVLDFIAALAFCEKPVQAHFIVYRSGHEFDLKFISHFLKKVRG